mmetsp:Transcript_23195/g.39263  ORF Transcript_23195/g.39263 Transcript_23195/m.39263 type:complete len:166 (+) Transcript_23195:114-611(+)
MIDCITACFEGLFLSNEDSPPSPRPRRRGTPSSRSSNRSATYNPFTVFKEDSDIDSSSNHLLHEDRAAIELQRQEQIEKYTHRDLLYKQPVDTGADTSNIDNDEPECVMCLGNFTEDNPVMPTLCNCGENRALFHYPCVVQWKEKYDWCPSCKATLFYQDVDVAL